MLVSLAILGAALGIACAVVLRTKGGEGLVEGCRQGGGLFLEVFPNLVLGFLMAGMLMVALPKEGVAHWMGASAGLRGILVGTAAGLLMPGGPFLQFPIVAGLLKAGAGLGAVTAYIVAWGVLGLQRFLVWEIPVLGWKVALLRFGACLVVPIIAGWIAQVLEAIVPS